MTKQSKCQRCGGPLGETRVDEATIWATAQGRVGQTVTLVPGDVLYCGSCWRVEGDLIRERLYQRTLADRPDASPDDLKREWGRLVAEAELNGFFWWKRSLAGSVKVAEERRDALRKRADRGRPKSGPVWATDREVARLFTAPCDECGSIPHQKGCKVPGRERQRRHRSLL
jgi:hypothetical protein